MTAMRRLTCEAAEDLAPLYVLGALEPADAAAVRAHLATCPRAHDEFRTLGGVVPYLAEAVEPLEPPAALGERIREAVAADVRAQRRDESAAERLLTSMGGPPLAAAPAPIARSSVPAAEQGHSQGTPPARTAPAAGGQLIDLAERRERRMSTARLRPFLQLAAVLLIAVMAGWNLLLQGQLGSLQHRDAQLRQAVAAAAEPDAIVAPMAGVEVAPNARGFAVLTPGQPGYLVVTGLPAPPVGRTYQAWYIENGTPRSAGLFDVDADGTGVMRGLQLSPSLEAVALSQERAGGATTPSEVYAIGEVGG